MTGTSSISASMYNVWLKATVRLEVRKHVITGVAAIVGVG